MSLIAELGSSWQHILIKMTPSGVPDSLSFAMCQNKSAPSSTMVEETITLHQTMGSAFPGEWDWLYPATRNIVTYTVWGGDYQATSLSATCGTSIYIHISGASLSSRQESVSSQLYDFKVHSCFEAAILALRSRRISTSTLPVKYQVMDAMMIAIPTKPMAIANEVS